MSTHRGAGDCAHGLGVLVGAAGLGFVAAPRLGSALGLFAIESDGEAFFSWLLLRGAPWLVGLSGMSAFLFPLRVQASWAWRIGLCALNAAGVWIATSLVSLLVLG